jgi:glycyl-tRNA synthetase (class II)
MVDAYTEITDENGEVRKILKFDPKIAPITI